MQQLESGLVGVVCGWNRSWGAKNDLSALLTVIGLRVVNDVGGARLLRKGRPVDHQERSQASLGHGLAAALRDGALGARIWLQQLHFPFFSFTLRRGPRGAIWTSSSAATMQQREGGRPEPLRNTIHLLSVYYRCRARRDVLRAEPGESSCSKAFKFTLSKVYFHSLGLTY